MKSDVLEKADVLQGVETGIFADEAKLHVFGDKLDLTWFYKSEWEKTQISSSLARCKVPSPATWQKAFIFLKKAFIFSEKAFIVRTFSYVDAFSRV